MDRLHVVFTKVNSSPVEAYQVRDIDSNVLLDTIVVGSTFRLYGESGEWRTKMVTEDNVVKVKCTRWLGTELLDRFTFRDGDTGYLAKNQRQMKYGTFIPEPMDEVSKAVFQWGIRFNICKFSQPISDTICMRDAFVAVNEVTGKHVKLHQMEVYTDGTTTVMDGTEEGTTSLHIEGAGYIITFARNRPARNTIMIAPNYNLKDILRYMQLIKDISK